MVEAWITTEFDEVRLIFKQEDYERIMDCKDKTHTHFKLHSTNEELCWVHECDIAIALYAISCLYSIKVS